MEFLMEITLKRAVMTLSVFCCTLQLFIAPSVASAPDYADTTVPKILSLSPKVVSQAGLPNIQLELSIRTRKNLAQRVQITFTNTVSRTIFDSPCQGGIFAGSMEGKSSTSRNINEFELVKSQSDGDWVVSDYVFMTPLDDKINQNDVPYCRGKYSVLDIYIEDIARHYVGIGILNEVVGQWARGFGQHSNVWDALPSSATCPRYPGYPSDATRSVCDVNTEVLSASFQISDSDWAKAAADKAAADKAAALKKVTINCVKGKVTKKVTAIKPKCPSGYKKK